MSAGRKALAPDIQDALEVFCRAVFAEAALPEKTNQLIAVAVPNVSQRRYCITGNTKLMRRKGASPEEIVEAIEVTAEMRAAGACEHTALVIHATDQVDAHTRATAADGQPS
jgi:AhpD family alkylhydroperoxidase